MYEREKSKSIKVFIQSQTAVFKIMLPDADILKQKRQIVHPKMKCNFKPL